MDRSDQKETAGKLAAEYFGNGYHCAEAVAAAVLETMNEDSHSAVAHACAFGGGFGESFKEACGVLSGSLIVIGHLHGRSKRGESWQDAAKLGAEVTKRFVALHGTSNCGELRGRFGEEFQMDRCRDMVVQGVSSLVETLDQDVSAGANEQPCDATACSACS
ncbi:MAG: C-GCAxxG-C-C family protein [Desulfocapsaceae bacterium]|nr:C-GCAxxG-C-C family protein [Desulfocapsaceae bacterium]